MIMYPVLCIILSRKSPKGRVTGLQYVFALSVALRVNL